MLLHKGFQFVLIEETSLGREPSSDINALGGRLRSNEPSQALFEPAQCIRIYAEEGRKVQVLNVKVLTTQPKQIFFPETKEREAFELPCVQRRVDNQARTILRYGLISKQPRQYFNNPMIVVVRERAGDGVVASRQELWLWES